MDKCILIIDDNDQKVNVRSLKMQVKGHCNLDVIDIRTTNSAYKAEDSEHLDINKLKHAIGEAIKGKSIAWAFTDFNLSEDFINGLSVVRILKELRKSIKIVMYSGNLEDVVRNVVGKSLNSANEEDVIKAVKSLMEYEIVDYIKRDDYISKAVQLIKRDEDPTVQDYFLQQLRMYSDMEFKSCYPKLSGKTLGEIADMIENSPDKRTDIWTQELIEQAVAYLIKINS